MWARIRVQMFRVTLAALVCAECATAGPILDIAAQHLSGTRISGVYGPTYTWDYSYDLLFQNQTLLVQLGVELVGDDTGTALRNQWEYGVESTWSNHFDILDGAYRYPILLDLAWVDSTVPMRLSPSTRELATWTC